MQSLYQQCQQPGNTPDYFPLFTLDSLAPNPAALHFLRTLASPTRLCCVVGPAQTGKTFLITKLLSLQLRQPSASLQQNKDQRGSAVLWTKPLVGAIPDISVYIIEMAMPRAQDGMYAVMSLLCGCMMWNCGQGAMDFETAGELKNVVEIKQKLGQKTQLQPQIQQCMPSFVWICRDYENSSRYTKGRLKTPGKLLQQKLSIPTSQTSSIHPLLLHPQRTCLCLPPPVSSPKQLSALQTLPDHLFRHSFLQAVNQLRQHIILNTQVKKYRGHELDGVHLSAMFQYYTGRMSQGLGLSIGGAWDCAMKAEAEWAYESAVARYEELYRESFYNQEPKGQEDLYVILAGISGAAIEQLQTGLSQVNPQAQNKLKQYISDKQSNIIEVNRQLLYFGNIVTLRQCMSDLIQKLQLGQLEGRAQQAAQQLRLASEQYTQQSRGQDKGQILAEFIAMINPIISRSVWRQSENIQHQKIHEMYREKLAMLEKQSDILKQQLRQDREGSEGKEGKKGSNVAKNKYEHVGYQGIPLKQRKCAGCAKCEIM